CLHVCARKGGAKSNNGVASDARAAILFKPRRVQFLEIYNAMNWGKFVLLGCVVACVLAASTATAQMRGHGNSMSRMGMHSASTPRSLPGMPMHRAPMPGSMGRMPMHRAPMMNSALGLRRFNHFNDGDFDRDDRFHHINNFNEIIFINFGLPWWPGWGWGPWWDWNWGYTYGSYYSGYGYGYGNSGYGYGSSGYEYGYGYPSVNYYGSYSNGTEYGNDDES